MAEKVHSDTRQVVPASAPVGAVSEHVPELTNETYRIHWGAIFAGLFVTAGLWILFHILGMAAGFTAVSPNEPSSFGAALIGTGIWSVIYPLLALFAGGFVAGRTAGALERGSGAIHGGVLWGATMLLGIVLSGLAVSALVGGLARVGRGVVGGAVSAAVGGDSGQPGNTVEKAWQALGLDTNAMLQPINQRLTEAGQPNITAAQLERTLRDVIDRALRQGNLDQQMVVTALAQNTALTRTDVQEIAATVAQRWEGARNNLEAQLKDVREAALQAVDTTGNVLWWVFLALLLGLASAVLGAILGISERQRRSAEVAHRAIDSMPLRTDYGPAS